MLPSSWSLFLEGVLPETPETLVLFLKFSSDLLEARIALEAIVAFFKIFQFDDLTDGSKSFLEPEPFVFGVIIGTFFYGVPYLGPSGSVELLPFVPFRSILGISNYSVLAYRIGLGGALKFLTCSF